MFLGKTLYSRSDPTKDAGALGRVVRQPVNANPGLKVNRSINFSCLNFFFTAYVFGSLRLKLKDKQYKQKTDQTVTNLNSKFSLTLG